MRLLFVGTLCHQHLLNFSQELNNLGFEIFGFDLAGDFYKKIIDKQNPYKKVWVKSSKSGFFSLITKFFGPLFLFIRIKENIDVVQFHYMDVYTLPLIIVSKFKKLKVSCFVYGSDFLHATKWQRRYLCYVFSFSDSIVCDSVTLCKKLKDNYPKYSDKISSLNFGSIIIDKLLKNTSSKNVMNKREPDKKICIMCGYNGSKAQNHFKIIESILTIPEYRNKVRLIIPMTYQCEKEYINELDEKLSATNIEYLILSSFISDSEWGDYLRSTDIFIHMQDSDAFSSTLAEHLLLGNVVINASWLEYEDLSANDVYFFKTDFDNLANTLSYCISNYQQECYKHASNSDKIVKLKSLKYCCENYWKPYFLSLT